MSQNEPLHLDTLGAPHSCQAALALAVAIAFLIAGFIVLRSAVWIGAPLVLAGAGLIAAALFVLARTPAGISVGHDLVEIHYMLGRQERIRKASMTAQIRFFAHGDGGREYLELKPERSSRFPPLLVDWTMIVTNTGKTVNRAELSGILGINVEERLVR